MIRLQRIYEVPDAQDGTRILVELVAVRVG